MNALNIDEINKSFVQLPLLCFLALIPEDACYAILGLLP